MFLADQLAGLVKHLAAGNQSRHIRTADQAVLVSLQSVPLEWNATNGALAQLGEHLLCKQRVIGSIPIRSTIELSLDGAALVSPC